MALCLCFPNFYKRRGLPLLNLPVHLQENIISKFEWKSYFNMQQTCHDMAYFIRTNRYIRICWPNSLNITMNSYGFPKYYLTRDLSAKKANFECLNGVRLDFVAINESLSILFKYYLSFMGEGVPTYKNFIMEICLILKKYRITSNEMHAMFLNDYTDEQYEELLKVLKPVKVFLTCRESELVRILLKMNLQSSTFCLAEFCHVGKKIYRCT